jgi:hypothetical protein
LTARSRGIRCACARSDVRRRFGVWIGPSKFIGRRRRTAGAGGGNDRHCCHGRRWRRRDGRCRRRRWLNRGDRYRLNGGGLGRRRLADCRLHRSRDLRRWRLRRGTGRLLNVDKGSPCVGRRRPRICYIG